jgi:ABC-type glycerol-3-phosphate transport system substrate-binding protein
LYARSTKTWERKLSKLLSFVAVAALALSFSSGANAQAAPGTGVAKTGVHHHHWQPKKHHYGKRMRAHWGASCKMSGSC